MSEEPDPLDRLKVRHKQEELGEEIAVLKKSVRDRSSFWRKFAIASYVAAFSICAYVAVTGARLWDAQIATNNERDKQKSELIRQLGDEEGRLGVMRKEVERLKAENHSLQATIARKDTASDRMGWKTVNALKMIQPAKTRDEIHFTDGRAWIPELVGVKRQQAVLELWVFIENTYSHILLEDQELSGTEPKR